ncbi:MAG: hypothetical protein ACLUDQ_14365 [Bilophila wadsworthia]
MTDGCHPPVLAVQRTDRRGVRHVRDAQFGTGFRLIPSMSIMYRILSPVLPQRRHENTPGMWFSVQVWPRSLSRSGQIMKRRTCRLHHKSGMGHSSHSLGLSRQHRNGADTVPTWCS